MMGDQTENCYRRLFFNEYSSMGRELLRLRRISHYQLRNARALVSIPLIDRVVDVSLRLETRAALILIVIHIRGIP